LGELKASLMLILQVGFTLAKIIYESSDGSNTSDLGMLNW